MFTCVEFEGSQHQFKTGYDHLRVASVGSRLVEDGRLDGLYSAINNVGGHHLAVVVKGGVVAHAEKFVFSDFTEKGEAWECWASIAAKYFVSVEDSDCWVDEYAISAEFMRLSNESSERAGDYLYEEVYDSLVEGLPHQA